MNKIHFISERPFENPGILRRHGISHDRYCMVPKESNFISRGLIFDRRSGILFVDKIKK